MALDVKTGRRKWHYQTVHHDVWDWDLPCAPILFDMTVNGRTVKALAQPTKQAFLFVLNRETGEPIWPIEERPVPQSDVPKERTSPTQPFPTKPAPFDLQGITENDLLDLTPALKAEALEVVKRYKMGPLFTPPVRELARRAVGDAAGAVGRGRRQLAGRFIRPGEQLPVHPLAHGRVPQRPGAGQSGAVRHGIRRRDRRAVPAACWAPRGCAGAGGGRAAGAGAGAGRAPPCRGCR